MFIIGFCTVTPSSFKPLNETVSVISTIKAEHTGRTSNIKSIDFENSDFVAGESSSSSFDQIQNVHNENHSIPKSKSIPVLSIKSRKLFKDKIVSSLDYNRKLPDDDDLLKLKKTF